MSPQQRLLNRLASALEPLSREITGMFGECHVKAVFSRKGVQASIEYVSDLSREMTPPAFITTAKPETPAPILKKSRKGGAR